MALFDVYRKRRAVLEFDTSKHDQITRADIEMILWQAWKCTPGKNNFMPYNVHVVGPTQQNYKDLVYQNCLDNEVRASGIDPAIKYAPGKPLPFFQNIATCAWLLIFTARLETELSPYQRDAMARGQNFEYATRSGMEKSMPSISIEVGMFCDLVGGLCLEKGIDVSQVLCFSRKLSTWKDVPFIKDTPLLVMPLGKAKTYKGVTMTNRRPNFPKIVKFVE